MQKLIIITLTFIISTTLYSQIKVDTIKRKKNNVLALFPRNYTTNNGLTITHWINESQDANGLHLEILGRGIGTIATPLWWYMLSDSLELNNLNDSLNSWTTGKINGMTLSPLGLFTNSYLNGLSLNGFGFYIPKLKGVGISIFEAQSINIQGLVISGGWTRVGLMQGVAIGSSNNCSVLKGLQIGYSNYCTKGQGLQISIFNRAGEDFRGIQIGLLNKIGKLYLPIINMKFRNKNNK